MSLLSFGSRGFLNWFPVHGTSIYENNTLVSSDNKGMAAYLYESSIEPNAMPGNQTFVAGFAQANVSDTSPNTLGAFCESPGKPYDGQPCQANSSTCGGTVEDCHGRGPQLLWADAREFAMCYVRERMYEGRFGERDAALESIVEYTSSLAPAHHYTVPLLPASAALDAQLAGEGEAGRRAITVPTHHGVFPIYPFTNGSCTSPSRFATDRKNAPRLVGTIVSPCATCATCAQSEPEQEQGREPQPRDSLLRAFLALPFIPTHPHAGSRARLLAAPPARLLFFARMQMGMRMGVPPHLPRDRAEAAARWAADGGLGPQPIRPTQEDIHEKNARPLVRFEGQSPTLGSSSTSASTSATATLTSTASMGITGTTSAGATSTAATSAGTAAAAIDALLAVDPGLDLDHHESTEEDGRDDRWATHRWRARFCTGYAPRPLSRASTLSPAGMPSEPLYTALVAAPGGAFPPGSLARDDFVAVARPVYMRIREHWSFHPDHPAPPPAPDTTTADEGMHNGWLPPGTRVDGVGGRCVDVRVDGGGGVEKGRPGAERPSSNEDSQATSSSAESSPSSKSQHSDSSSWAEWDAPAWAAPRFDDEGWDGICAGVQDVTFTGETDPRHGMAWHHYEYAGCVRPWDGLIGLVMRPRDRTLGLATYFISGHLAGRDTFQGTWQMAGQDVLVPSWGGSVCLARGED
ncbi:Neutral/alkaline non-lysosomal ceramidase-domain-containing protein [Mycena vitilis]|nr:Neutral/alkaline non-lysosomal ceramidase-domain-containing protein [Mycena vitilis]